MITTLYIIDPTQEFSGHCENTMTSKEGVPIHVDYMDKPTTLEEYRIQKNNPNLIAVDYPAIKELYDKYEQKLQKPWVEITKERYEDLLECLPPCGWRNISPGLNVFYMMEAYTGNLHDHLIFDRVQKKYFMALRPKDSTNIRLFNDYTQQFKLHNYAI